MNRAAFLIARAEALLAEYNAGIHRSRQAYQECPSAIECGHHSRGKGGRQHKHGARTEAQ